MVRNRSWPAVSHCVCFFRRRGMNGWMDEREGDGGVKQQDASLPKNTKKRTIWSLMTLPSSSTVRIFWWVWEGGGGVCECVSEEGWCEGRGKRTAARPRANARGPQNNAPSRRRLPPSSLFLQPPVSLTKSTPIVEMYDSVYVSSWGCAGWRRGEKSEREARRGERGASTITEPRRVFFLRPFRTPRHAPQTAARGRTCRRRCPRSGGAVVVCVW
jgi:hypothetical protein